MRKKIVAGSWPYYLSSLVLHLIGIAMLWVATIHNPGFWGLGLLAYTLGLRHAFDADHIAAIDNTVRKLVHQQKNSYGVGFFFSLGHSTVVFVMAILVSISIKWAKVKLPLLALIGGKVGSLISGSFLVIVAAFNCLVLVNLYRSLKAAKKTIKTVNMSPDDMPKGFLTSLLRPLFQCINHSWQMYPIGFLFGLGFDTATEITLIALSGAAAQSSVATVGIIALPILFAAGMNVMDTTDSVMMASAYTWAFETPLRKLYYNLIVTTVSVLAAFSIGSVELVQVAAATFHITGGIWGVIQNLDFNSLGYWLVLLFALLWLVSYLVWTISLKKRNPLV